MLDFDSETRTVPNVSVYGPDYHFLGSMVGRCEMLPHFFATCSQCQWISLVV